MTNAEKIAMLFRLTTLAVTMVVSVWFGSMISDLTKLMEASAVALQNVERLIELGPDSIVEMGEGLKQAEELVGEGGHNAVSRIKDAFKSTTKGE